ARSPKAWNWIKSCQDSLKSLFFMEENSDMGLQHLVRVLYLYGTLPPHLPADRFPARRRRFDVAQAQLLAKFVTDHATLATLIGALHANSQDLAECDFRFSPVAEAIIKQTLLRSKFWLDEPFKVVEQKALQDAREANKIDKDTEMQYWSENHYIMF